MMAQAPIEDLLEQADFVFSGTAERVGDATLPEIETSDATAVVVVDEIVRAPEQFAALTGSRITVMLREPASVREGEQALFFTTGWLFGDGIAVQELEHRPVEEAPESLRAAVGGAVEASQARRLQQRVEEADAVIAGRVTAVRPSEQTATAALGEQPTAPITEHDPQWWEAVVDVETVVKGDITAEPTVVLFPGSMDVAWRDAPKFHPGQEGVWLLHREDVPAAADAAFPQVFTVTNSDDFHEKERLDDVRKLVEEGGA
jgi:hypothetical protein